MKMLKKQLKLHLLQYAKNTIFIIFIIFFITPANAQLGGNGLDKNTPYDQSDFKFLTAEKFLETNFNLIKKAYIKFPHILEKGYLIEVIANKRQGFRPSVRTNQLYAQLLESAVLEWAILNDYKVYREGGYRIEQKLDDVTEVNIAFTSGFWGSPVGKTLEQVFKKDNLYLYKIVHGNYSLINSESAIFG